MSARTRDGRIGLAEGIALYVASVLGTGLLALPALAAEAAGPGSILAVAAVILLAIPLAGTFAALAARYPDPGGVASYVRRALGPTAARMTGYWFMFGVAAGGPVVAVLGAQYVALTAGIDANAVPWLAFAFLVVPLGVNAFGVRMAGGIQLVLTALLIGVVVTVVWAAAPAVEPQNFTPFLPHGLGGVGTAVVLYVWAFAGWEVGTHISGEFRNPRRAVLIGTAVTLILSGACYLVLQVITVGALGTAAGTSAAPLLDLAALADSPLARIAVGVIGAIVALGVLNAYLAAFAKLGASLAENGDLPRWFSTGAGAGAVPRRALALTAVVMVGYFTLVLVSGLNLAPFVLVHTSSMTAIYVLGMIAAVRILDRWSLGWWTAIVASVLSAGLLVLAAGSLLPAIVLALVAVVITLIRRRGAHRQRPGAGPVSTNTPSAKSDTVTPV
ncbi:APC family permease [Microbacterium sp. ZW T5_56]|uniref:APC family permease n=1 Tax=Microbacterium sp. ZW T5_56 TaxID=3378081 RepID=UPI0038540637